MTEEKEYFLPKKGKEKEFLELWQKITRGVGGKPYIEFHTDMMWELAEGRCEAVLGVKAETKEELKAVLAATFFDQLLEYADLVTKEEQKKAIKARVTLYGVKE